MKIGYGIKGFFGHLPSTFFGLGMIGSAVYSAVTAKASWMEALPVITIGAACLGIKINKRETAPDRDNPGDRNAGGAE